MLPTLRQAGLDLWYSADDIGAADRWDLSIRKGLESSDWFLVVISENSLNSKWVDLEVHWWWENRDGNIVPVLIDNSKASDLHLALPTIQHVDFRQNIPQARCALLDVLKLSTPETRSEAVGSTASKPERNSPRFWRWLAMGVPIKVGIAVSVVVLMIICIGLVGTRDGDNSKTDEIHAETIEVPDGTTFVGSVTAPRFEVLWVKDGLDGHCEFDQDDTELSTTNTALTLQNYRLSSLSGYYDSKGDLRFAGAWVKGDARFPAKYVAGAPQETFLESEKQNKALGYRLSSVDACGDGDRQRWCAVWLLDHQPCVSLIDVSSDDLVGPDHPDRGALTPCLVARVPRTSGSARYAAVLLERDRHGPLWTYGRDDFLKKLKESERGMRIISIDAIGRGNARYWTGVWGENKSNVPWKVSIHLLADELRRELADHEKQGYRPEMVDAD